jgi:hypothetical protein
MVTKAQRKTIETAKERAGSGWEALMRDVRAGKVTGHDAMRLRELKASIDLHSLSRRWRNPSPLFRA